jgi:hypothetical protein
MDGSAGGSAMGSIMDLVLREIVYIDVRVYLAARNAAATQAGSADEFRLEVCAADVPAESVCRSALAVYG